MKDKIMKTAKEFLEKNHLDLYLELSLDGDIDLNQKILFNLMEDYAKYYHQEKVKKVEVCKHKNLGGVNQVYQVYRYCLDCETWIE